MIDVMAEPDQLLTTSDVANWLNVQPIAVQRMAAEGRLPGFKIGKYWRFEREDIEKWIEEQKSLADKD